jgi:hypothetical protein
MDRAMVCLEVRQAETVERICLHPWCIVVLCEIVLMDDIIITCPVCITDRQIIVLVD